MARGDLLSLLTFNSYFHFLLPLFTSTFHFHFSLRYSLLDIPYSTRPAGNGTRAKTWIHPLVRRRADIAFKSEDLNEHSRSLLALCSRWIWTIISRHDQPRQQVNFTETYDTFRIIIMSNRIISYHVVEEQGQWIVNSEYRSKKGQSECRTRSTEVRRNILSSTLYDIVY